MTSGGTVIDASVAIKWVRIETHSDWARSFLATGTLLLAPDLLLLECGSVFWRLRRQGEAEAPEPGTLLERMLALPLRRIRADDGLARAALRLATRLDHPVYDCLYLALALDRGAALATADARFAAAVRHAGLLPSGRLLTPPAAG